VLNGFCYASVTFGRNRSSIERDPQVISHSLDPLVIGTFEPRQHGVSWEVIRPTLQGLGYLDPQLGSLLENR